VPGRGFERTTIFAATSRGAMPTGFASWSAMFVVKSP
jgi:hypothetical protein